MLDYVLNWMELDLYLDLTCFTVTHKVFSSNTRRQLPKLLLVMV